MTARLTLDLTSTLIELLRLAPAWSDFAAAHELSVADQFSINLALEEVVVNIITHGYKGSPEGTIHIEVEITAHEIIAVIEDEAPPFDPRLIKPPKLAVPVEDRPPGGLGMHLVRQVVEGMDYEFRNGKNRLTLTRKRTSEENGGEQLA